MGRIRDRLSEEAPHRLEGIGIQPAPHRPTTRRDGLERTIDDAPEGLRVLVGIHQTSSKTHQGQRHQANGIRPHRRIEHQLDTIGRSHRQPIATIGDTHRTNRDTDHTQDRPMPLKEGRRRRDTGPQSVHEIEHLHADIKRELLRRNHRLTHAPLEVLHARIQRLLAVRHAVSRLGVVTHRPSAILADNRHNRFGLLLGRQRLDILRAGQRHGLLLDASSGDVRDDRLQRVVLATHRARNLVQYVAGVEVVEATEVSGHLVYVTRRLRSRIACIPQLAEHIAEGRGRLQCSRLRHTHRPGGSVAPLVHDGHLRTEDRLRLRDRLVVVRRLLDSPREPRREARHQLRASASHKATSSTSEHRRELDALRRALDPPGIVLALLAAQRPQIETPCVSLDPLERIADLGLRALAQLRQETTRRALGLTSIRRQIVQRPRLSQSRLRRCSGRITLLLLGCGDIQRGLRGSLPRSRHTILSSEKLRLLRLARLGQLGQLRLGNRQLSRRALLLVARNDSRTRRHIQHTTRPSQIGSRLVHAESDAISQRTASRITRELRILLDGLEGLIQITRNALGAH